jgi:hypothetical protein
VALLGPIASEGELLLFQFGDKSGDPIVGLPVVNARSNLAVVQNFLVYFYIFFAYGSPVNDKN